MDQDGDGRISYVEFAEAVKKLATGIKDEQLYDLMKRYANSHMPL